MMQVRISDMERDIQIQAIVTSVRNFGEMHKSVTLFTSQLGLINAIIFGGRKGKKTALAPLFSYGTFQLYYNPVKDEYSLVEEDCEFTAFNITKDIEATYTASYICEVINSITTDENEQTYLLAKQALNALDNKIENHRKVLIDFTWQILKINGVGTDLTTCPSCDRKLDQNEDLLFSTSMMTPVCKNCSDTDTILLSPGARKYLTYTFNMSFEQAYQVQLLEGATQRLTAFLTKWITAFCQKPLKTVKSGLL